MGKNIVMVSVFPEIREYINDYFLSIKNQTNKHFTLLVLSDHLDVESLKEAPDDCIVLDVPDGFNPIQVRLLGIKYAKENGYENLIFSDGDDYYSDNRVELTLDELNRSDFVVNDIKPVNKHGNLIPVELNLYVDDPYTSYKDILDYNLFGLGNTALKVELLDNLDVPKSNVAMDWWLYTILLINGAKGKFIHSATSFYRQTNINIVGMKKLLDKDRLLYGIDAKTIHYKSILEYSKKCRLDFAVEDYSKKLEEMKALSNAVADKEFGEFYINVINANLDQIYKGWWSEILPIKQWRTYDV